MKARAKKFQRITKKLLQFLVTALLLVQTGVEEGIGKIKTNQG